MHKVARAIKRLFAPKFAPFQHPKIHKNHILQSRDNYRFLSQKHGFYLKNDAIKLPFGQKSRLCVFQNPLFFHPFFATFNIANLYGFAFVPTVIFIHFVFNVH